ncbi:MAG: class I SAM-dependent methyltransferase [Candidatus Nealsonbacteria bacterium]|nr:class I SAM-dependent methyltransferase [Candidatus Nealsonbacteria bacterium]
MAHEVNWTKEKAALFWDYCGYLYQKKPSFSKRFGEALLRIVEKRIPIQGVALDYGCGEGFLMDGLLKRKISCFGADASERALLSAAERLKGNPFFKGVFPADLPLKLGNEFINTVFLIETIEHITPDQFDFTIKEIRRVLKPGGYFVIEAHNEEPLDSGKMICPDCGGVFHRMGHLRSFSQDTLIELMQKCGFKKEFCLAASFRQKTIGGRIREIFNKKSKKSSLIYIGKKYDK